MERYITYEQFGAVGDGVADDMPAIVRAHDEANRLDLPVVAKEGATYLVSHKKATATVMTSTCWSGASFVIDDRDCEDIHAPVFNVTSTKQPVPLSISSLKRGQTRIDNPTGQRLYVIVKDRGHLDYIRFGLNQNNGTARADNFIVCEDGTLSSAVSFDFDNITDVIATPMDSTPLTIKGGTFTTIANQAESRYTYHARNIVIHRSCVEVSDITHLVTGELDHGAPYTGFISIVGCAEVTVHDCVFTGHYIYSTIGNAGKPVMMGSYDINCSSASSVTFRSCSQTTDIMDKRYWGLIGSNFCRDLVFEDCRFSRFDAHMGVSNCTLRRCTLGWQCLNAIGNGTFLIEDTTAYGYAFVNLREDFGSSWRGDMIIKNCTWHPLGESRSIFSASNDGHHFFGYDCYITENVTIDGFEIAEDSPDDRPLFIFNDYAKNAADRATPYPPIPPLSVKVSNIRTDRPILLCQRPSLMPTTTFSIGAAEPPDDHRRS